MTTRPLNLAVVGATGLVGRAVLEALADADLPVKSLRLLGSPRAAGTRLEFDGDELPVAAVSDGAFRGVDVALLCAPAEVARALAPKAWASGCAVVDHSAAFRGEPDVPLVVPEVNPEALAGYRARGIVASPSGPVTALAVALGPIARAAGLTRLVVSTYECVSGAGQKAVEQLEREATDLMNGREPDAGAVVPHRIAFNVVPQVGAFREDGRSDEEAELETGLRRVLGLPALGVAATAVRVPVFYGHAAAVNLGTERPLSAADARLLLKGAPGLKVIDDPAERIYPMPMLAVNDEAVLVGRVRDDRSQPRGLDLFVVVDNLKKGAATNLVQIAALLGEKHL